MEYPARHAHHHHDRARFDDGVSRPGKGPRTADLQSALGRYRASWLVLALPTLAAALTVIAAAVAIMKGQPDVGTFVLTGVWVLGAVLVWRLPATVITTAGFRRRGSKITPWTEVAAVFPAGPGDPDVLIALRNGKKVSLVGVDQEQRAGIIALARKASQDSLDGPALPPVRMRRKDES